MNADANVVTEKLFLHLKKKKILRFHNDILFSYCSIGFTSKCGLKTSLKILW